ncbi:MAG: hypothetical protein AB7H97_04475, partial [Pseudobdellovibrionaceae bacterium]
VVYDRKLYLLDISAPPAVTILGTKDFEKLKVLQYSKLIDPHLVIKNEKKALERVYAENSQLKVQPITHYTYEIEKSRLDLVRNNWTVIDVQLRSPDSYDPYNKQRIKQINRWRLSDMYAREAIVLAENPVRQLGENSVLSLFPSAMGYAENLDLDMGTKKILRNFNVPYFP